MVNASFAHLLGALASGDGWRSWRPSDPPFPAMRGEVCAQDGELRFAARRRSSAAAQIHPMCLARDDLISNAIRRKGRWYDCGKFVRLWHELDGVRFGGRRHLGAGEGPEGVLVEVGANIGACTLELLLRTKARIIAFEPSPSNLFYLTRTLQLAAQRDPAIAERVVVYPIGVGDAPSRLPLFTQRGNLGNTVVGQALSDDCVGRRAGAECLNRTMAAGAKGEVTVLPLDTVFPLGMGGVRLVKLDVQGFECHVLQGASHALARAVPPVGVVAAEVAPTWLYGQCCRPSFLVHLLSRIGSGGGGLVDGSGSGGGIVASGGSHHGYNVTCTKRVGPDYTCLGRPPHGTSLANANELHETPPTPTHLATLRRKMATCERRRKARVVR